MRTAGLKAIECLLQQKGSLVAPSTTRWLSIEQSVNKLRACLTSVVISLQRKGEERGDAKALGLQAMVREYRFVATMLLMCDTLPHVTRMSKCFQLTDCDYSLIPSILATTLASLEQLKTHDGLNLSKFNAFLTSLEESGIEIKKPANMSETYFTDSIRMPFLTHPVDNILLFFRRSASLPLRLFGSSWPLDVQCLRTLSSCSSSCTYLMSRTATTTTSTGTSSLTTVQ